MGCVTKGLWTLEMTCHRPSGPSALLASPGQTFLQNFLRCPPTISGPLSPFITPLPPLHTLQGPVRCRPWAKSGWRSTSQDQAHPSLWVPEAVCPPLLPSPSPPWRHPSSKGLSSRRLVLPGHGRPWSLCCAFYGPPCQLAVACATVLSVSSELQPPRPTAGASAAERSLSRFRWPKLGMEVLAGWPLLRPPSPRWVVPLCHLLNSSSYKETSLTGLEPHGHDLVSPPDLCKGPPSRCRRILRYRGPDFHQQIGGPPKTSVPCVHTCLPASASPDRPSRLGQ